MRANRALRIEKTITSRRGNEKSRSDGAGEEGREIALRDHQRAPQMQLPSAAPG